MNAAKQLILKQEQRIARAQNALVIEKLKQRRADTRRKIELGGLVVKAGMDSHNKAVTLGALAHAMQLIETDETYLLLFEAIGTDLFLSGQTTG